MLDGVESDDYIPAIPGREALTVPKDGDAQLAPGGAGGEAPVAQMSESDHEAMLWAEFWKVLDHPSTELELPYNEGYDEDYDEPEECRDVEAAEVRPV